MPHFIAECTDNIREQADLPGLFAQVNQALAATGIFPIGGIRSRAIWLDTWQMADGRQDYAFVHMTLKIGSGHKIFVTDLPNASKTPPAETEQQNQYKSYR